MENKAEKLVLSVEEMAEALGIHVDFARKLIKREGFPAVWLSKNRVVIPVEDLKRWLSKNCGYPGK